MFATFASLYIFVAIAVQMNAAHRTPCPTALPRAEARWITTWAGWPRGFISVGRKLALRKGT